MPSDGDEVEDRAVVADLADGRKWKAVQIDLLYAACRAGEE
jgi:hypothetical protein